MADEQQADEQQTEDQAEQIEQPTEAQATPPADATGDENGGNEARFTQADIDRILKERLDRAKAQADKAAAKAAEDAQRKAAEDQGKYKELYEEMQAKLTEAEQRAAEMERAAMRQQATAQAGLPAALADRLRGDTLDEMLDDAKALQALIPKKDAPTNINGTARGTTKQAPDDDEIRRTAAQLGVSYELMKQHYGG